MRQLLFLFTLLTLQSSAFSQKKSTPKSSVYELSDALKQKLVAVEVTGTGGHMGASLKITCRNLRGKFLRLRIPAGQFMEPSDSSMQTLVVAEEHTLAVGTKAPAGAMLKTFCAQAGDRSPISGSAFAVGALAPENLRQLLKFIVENGKVNNPEAQTAVWCVTNGESLGSIGDAELMKFTAGILGKKAPGYRIIQKTVREVPGERAAPGKALVVDANFRYFLEKDEKLVMNLLDSEGKFVKQISGEELMKAGEHRSSFHLEVWNLPKGKYTVRVQTKDGRVINDMEVEF